MFGQIKSTNLWGETLLNQKSFNFSWFKFKATCCSLSGGSDLSSVYYIKPGDEKTWAGRFRRKICITASSPGTGRELNMKPRLTSLPHPSPGDNTQHLAIHSWVFPTPGDKTGTAQVLTTTSSPWIEAGLYPVFYTYACSLTLILLTLKSKIV